MELPRSLGGHQRGEDHTLLALTPWRRNGHIWVYEWFRCPVCCRRGVKDSSVGSKVGAKEQQRNQEQQQCQEQEQMKMSAPSPAPSVPTNPPPLDPSSRGVCFDVVEQKEASDGRTYLRLSSDLGWTCTTRRDNGHPCIWRPTMGTQEEFMRGLPTIEPVPYDCHQLVSRKGILQALANQRSRLPVAPEWCLVQHAADPA